MIKQEVNRGVRNRRADTDSTPGRVGPCLCQVDARLQILTASRGLAHITGRPTKILVDRSLESLWGRAAAAALRVGLARASAFAGKCTVVAEAPWDADVPWKSVVIETDSGPGPVDATTYWLRFFQGSAPNGAADRLPCHAQERFDALVGGSPMGIVLLSDSAVVEANGAACSLLGVPVEEVRGVGIQTLLRRRVFRDDVTPATTRVESAGLPSGECEVLRRDGVTVPVEVRVTALPGRGAHDTAVFFLDTSRLRHLQREYDRAERLAEVALHTSGIAHDFNNLLTPILGFADLLREESGDANVVEFSDAIAASARRGADLVRSLMHVSRPSSGVFEEFDVFEVLKELEPLIRVLGGEPIALLMEETSGGRIHGDRGQIGQVIVNLVKNSVDAMESGGTLRIGARACDSWSRLWVEDDGPGMEPEQVTRIFEPFYTTKAPGRGTGLGLQTVRSIVEEHGGRISVRSAPGHGTRVEVTLPLRTESAAPLDHGHRLSHPTVALIIESDPSVMEVVGTLLEARGYVVTRAQDAFEGIELLDSMSKLDLLVVGDDHVVVSAGAIAREAIRRHAGSGVLVLSAGSETAASSLPPEAHVLSKPFGREGLATAVEVLLQSNGSQA